VAPTIASYWERAEFPHHLVPSFAALGLAGGNIQGYGCPVGVRWGFDQRGEDAFACQWCVACVKEVVEQASARAALQLMSFPPGLSGLPVLAVGLGTLP